MRSLNPVIFIEHKTLYGMEGPVPADSYTVPFGKGQVVREGRDVTIVTWGSMVKKTEAAAERLQHDGVEAEIIDLRTLSPWDRALVTHSVAKTRHLLVVHEACKTGGVGAEIIASTIEDWQGEQQPICARVAAKDAPIPYSKPMQDFVLPSVDEIASAASRCLEPRAVARQGQV
jgi:pyruvate dehydrogenase E1 component beta subunit